MAGTNKYLRILFKNDNKYFIRSQGSQFDKDKSQTVVLIAHEEEIEHGIKKIIQKIFDYKDKKFLNLIYPLEISTQNVNKTKTIVMQLNLQLLPVYYLVYKVKHKFTNLQIIEAAYCGLSSLKQLHLLNIVHGQINPLTFYFFNRAKQEHGKKIKGRQPNYFGVGIMDINLFRAKSYAKQKEIEISKQIFYSKNKMLGFRPSYKDDLEEFIYVLLYMISSGDIFSLQRYQKQWLTPEGLSKWKLKDLFPEMLKIVPPELWIILQIYLQVQNTSLNSNTFDYDGALKKIGKYKEIILFNLLHHQRTQKQLSNSYESSRHEKQQESDQNWSMDEIFQQQIKLSIHPELTGTKNIFTGNV